MVLHVMSMMRDIALTSDELSHVIAKSLRQLNDMDQNELPPLIYQLLLLSAKVTLACWVTVARCGNGLRYCCCCCCLLR